MAFTLHSRPGFVPPDPTPKYRIRLAGDEETVRFAQRLRFEVFNLELNEGLETSIATGLDHDEFDRVCDHLVVELIATGEVIGTYRLQTGRGAAENLGYYSEREFDFAPFEPVREGILELGRACVDRDHRNLAVLGLLWKGLARYARVNDSRYMIGCSSLTSRDPTEGIALYRSLPDRFLAPEPLRTLPLAEFSCGFGDTSTEKPRIPRLMQAYLIQGAKIAGPPAIDREFGTIDFLTIMDVKDIAPRYFH